jgi:hypothetical protein
MDHYYTLHVGIHILIFFLAHRAKGNVGFWRPSFVVRQLLNFHIFRYRPVRNKNCLWWPCLLTDRDKMSNLHRGHSIDASCHVSINLAKRK